jgi:hypothetical protein
VDFKILAVSCAGFSLLALGYAAEQVLVQSSPELWYFHHSYITSDDAVASSKKLIDKATEAGYTGVVFWDSSFNFMSNPDWSPDSEDRMKEVMKYAKKHHLKSVAYSAPFGWSNDVLSLDPNWAEAQRVTGSEFEVDASGKKLNLKNSFPGLVNGNFSGGKTAWFDTGDQGIDLNPNGMEGTPAGAITDPAGNGRLRQKITVKPWRQYYLSFFYKFKNFSANTPAVQVLDAANLNKSRFSLYLPPTGTPGWAQKHVMFNSQDSTELYLYFGIWGGAKGTVLFDNVALEETALVNVAHRDGAPFKLYDPANPATVFAEGSDYNKVLDPDMAPGVPAFHNVFHLPPAFTLPASTKLKPGQIVAADYYAVFPMAIDNEVGMCLTEPGVYKWISKNAKAIKKVLPQDSDVLLGYDEIRQANSCFRCRSKNMTAGELVAWSVGQTLDIYHSSVPNAPIWVWNDMFDPSHNAHDDFYYVEGNLAASWNGLPPDVSILNWNLDNLKKSLTFFSGIDPEQRVPHRQMIAGFYDRGVGAEVAKKELHEAEGIPGLVGMMYTTYSDNYTQLQSFADGARAGWPGYLASLPKKQ